MLIDTGPALDRILVFGREHDRTCAGEMKTVYGDGTFKTAPPLFAQIYVILAKRQGFVFPVLYTLLPNKEQQTYVRLFNEIRREWLEFEPDSFSIDYEIAVIRAVTEVFLDTHYFGCLFHLHQNIKKHVE